MGGSLFDILCAVIISGLKQVEYLSQGANWPFLVNIYTFP